jgi:hypothetical protein
MPDSQDDLRVYNVANRKASCDYTKNTTFGQYRDETKQKNAAAAGTKHKWCQTHLFVL